VREGAIRGGRGRKGASAREGRERALSLVIMKEGGGKKEGKEHAV